MLIDRLKKAPEIWPLLAIFLILGSWYAIALPIFEGADEISHFRVIEFIADHGSLPHIIDDGEIVGHEAGQPPLYYALLAPFIRPVDRTDFDQVVRENPHFLHLNSNSVWYHLTNETGRWRGTVLAVYIGRLLSLPLGAITIWCTWALAHTILPNDKRGFALLAAGFVTFNPQFLAISGSINNDNLVIALCSVALLLTVRWHIRCLNKEAPDKMTPFLLGVVIGLAVLSKISAIAFGGVIASVLSIRLTKKERLSIIIQDGLLVTAGFLLPSGWWFWRNQTLYGDPLGLDALSIAHAGTFRDVALTAAETLSESQLILKTFWLFPGNSTLFGPDWFYWVMNIAVLIGILGWLIPFNSKKPASSKPVAPLIVWVSLIVGLLFYWISTVGATSQGRLMYPALSAIAVLLILGFWRLPIFGRWLAYGMVGFLAIFAILTPSQIIQPAFAHPATLPSDFDYPNSGEARLLTPEIELLGYKIITHNLSVGEQPAIRLFWQTNAPVPESYYLTLHFVDAAGTEVSRYEGYPLNGRYPTNLWEVNEPFSEEIYLPQLSENTAGGLATLFVELTDWRGKTSTEFLPLASKIKVRLPEVETEPDVLTQVTFGSLAQLNGYSVQQSADLLTATFYWQAQQPASSEQTVFVHLLDKHGNLATQGDGIPRYGTYPTSFWETGEIVPDEHQLVLTDLEKGDYTLAVGFYDPVTGVRLPVQVDGAEQPNGFSIPLELP